MYLKLIPLKLGFLINFNELHLKDGITRVVNRWEGKPFIATSPPPHPSRATEAN